MIHDVESKMLLSITQQLSPSLIPLINAIQISTKIIQREINKAGFVGLHGIVDTVNSSGDTQKKLDVLSNEIMIEHLTHSRSCSYLLSEENDEKILIPTEYQGPYIVAFDPLDGSSNIDCNCCVGTIFSIFLDNGEEFQKGDSILCAGYILYGPATEMVISFGKNTGVYRFILDSSIGEYICVGKIQLPSQPKLIYSINEANHQLWESPIQLWIQQYKVLYTKYTQRYIGSMVADVHRTLLYGGVFCYPSDKKNIHGKLRILYECFPMAFLTEEAGGIAITSSSSQRILDITPTHIHQKTPIALGSTQEIQKLIQILNS